MQSDRVPRRRSVLAVYAHPDDELFQLARMLFMPRQLDEKEHAREYVDTPAIDVAARSLLVAVDDPTRQITRD